MPWLAAVTRVADAAARCRSASCACLRALFFGRWLRQCCTNLRAHCIGGVKRGRSAGCRATRRRQLACASSAVRAAGAMPVRLYWRSIAPQERPPPIDAEREARAFVEAAFAGGLAERDRDRRGRRVAVLVDGDERLLQRHVERLRRRPG